MTPEGHWAQALSDPDLGSYKVTPTKLGYSYILTNR